MIMDEAETRSRLEVHHSLTFTRVTRFLGPETARDSDRRVRTTATVSLRQTKRSGVSCSHARLQSRHPAPTSQSRFSFTCTTAEIRKVVDLDESFHTHRHDSITGAKKKNFVSNLSSTIKRRITLFCDAVVHGAATQGSSTAQVVVVHSDPRERQALTSQKAKTTCERTWLTTNRQVFSGSGAASQCAYDMTGSNRSKGRTTRPTAASINRHFLTQTSFCRRNDLCPQSVEVSF